MNVINLHIDNNSVYAELEVDGIRTFVEILMSYEPSIILNEADNLNLSDDDIALLKKEAEKFRTDLISRLCDGEIVKEQDTYRCVKVQATANDLNDLYFEIYLSSFEDPTIESIEQYYIAANGKKVYSRSLILECMLKDYAIEWANL